MDFGIGLLNYHGCWDDAAFAEQHGFATAGFVDSPLLAGDPFVCLGLAARATTTIRLGTFLAIPSLRGAPTAASAIATVSRIAPGRVFMAMGTGYTGRDTFGLRPIAAWKVRDYARDCRALLAGAAIRQPVGSSTQIAVDQIVYASAKLRPAACAASPAAATAAANTAGAPSSRFAFFSVTIRPSPASPAACSAFGPSPAT